jgi:DNA-binding NarL/FixJ family response regulator
LAARCTSPLRRGKGVQITLTVPLAQAGTLPGAGEETQLQGLRVVLADDHPLFLDGLRTLLTAHGAQVAGLAHDGVEAQRLAAAVQPALILMDVHMPHCDGLEATRRIHLAQPEIKIVMLTLAADEDSLHQALAAGASGYLLKSLDTLTFVRALAEILRGEVSLSPDIAAQILASFTTADAHAAETALTPQQTHILELVAQGLLYKQVAASLIDQRSNCQIPHGADSGAAARQEPRPGNRRRTPPRADQRPVALTPHPLTPSPPHPLTPSPPHPLTPHSLTPSRTPRQTPILYFSYSFCPDT